VARLADEADKPQGIYPILPALRLETKASFRFAHFVWQLNRFKKKCYNPVDPLFNNLQFEEHDR